MQLGAFGLKHEVEFILGDLTEEQRRRTHMCRVYRMSYVSCVQYEGVGAVLLHRCCCIDVVA